MAGWLDGWIADGWRAFWLIGWMSGQKVLFCGFQTLRCRFARHRCPHSNLCSDLQLSGRLAGSMAGYMPGAGWGMIGWLPAQFRVEVEV